LKDVLAKAGLPVPPSFVISGVVKGFDKNHSGDIDQKEFDNIVDKLVALGVKPES